MHSATVTSKDYLMKMLGGIERRRTEFWKGNYQEMALAGIPANKIEWRGKVKTFEIKGAFYTLISDGLFYAISLQDVLPHAENSLPAMIKAVEALKKQG